jgi:ribosome-binding ATPase YchF (GTP1/OBG family)
MKLTKQQIELIKERKKTITVLEIAKEFNISPSLVRYWTGRREKQIKQSAERIKNLSEEEKLIRYNKLKEYQKNYHKEKYLNDPIFREKARARSREYKRRKNE